MSKRSKPLKEESPKSKLPKDNNDDKITVFLSNNPKFQSYIAFHNIDTKTVEETYTKLDQEGRAMTLFERLCYCDNKVAHGIIIQWFSSHDGRDEEEHFVYWGSVLYVMLCRWGSYSFEGGFVGCGG